MKTYTCDKCNKKFNQKSDYDRHSSRKNPCVPIYIISERDNTIQELIQRINEKEKIIKEKDNIIKEKDYIIKDKEHIIKDKEYIIKEQNFEIREHNFEIRELKSKISGFENIISQKNEIIKTYSSLKKDQIETLISHKDNLYKENIETFLRTLKTYDNIQEVHSYINSIYTDEDKNDKNTFLLSNLYKRYKNEYIYLIRTRECVKLNEQIYKIGKTKKEDIKERFDHYPKGIEIIAFFSVKDADKTENDIIKIFNSSFTVKLEYGNEYFEGNIKDMLEQFINIILLEY